MSNYGESYYLEELEELQKEKVVTINPKKQIVIDKSELDFLYKQVADLEAKLAQARNKFVEDLTEIIDNNYWEVNVKGTELVEKPIMPSDLYEILDNLKGDEK